MADKLFDKKWVGMIIYFYVFCVLLALVEVQIEGPHGWASGNEHTWRPGEGWWTPLWHMGMGDQKELTGYHLLMNGFLLLVMHQHFFLGLKWSFKEEARALTRFVIIGTFWDLYWFLFNPAYGLGRFDHAHVWWHTQWVWGIPKHYLFMPIATMTTIVALNLCHFVAWLKRDIVGEWSRRLWQLAWNSRKQCGSEILTELNLLFATIGAFFVLTAATIAVAAAVVPYRP